MRLAIALLTALPLAALAQNEMPALPDDMPAVQTEAPAPATAPARTPAPAPAAGAPANAPAEGPAAPVPGAGTTVVGEREAPIGLYIMPWRQSSAEGGLDRPARLLDEALMPLDPEVFRRQVEYHRALTEHLKSQGRATP